ncbi:phage tail tip fiber protein [Pseudomonas alabamensis]|uniref:phage tail tip fiber protein n=1 Tax=Pseudomonas alabamensis TaxID=3064349 RepID=UPI0011AAF795
MSNLQGDLPKKADVSALTSLKGTVEQNGRDIKTYGQDLTTITTTLGGIGASGVNLLPAEYSVFSKTPPTLAGSSYNADTVADSAALRGYALKFDWSTTSVALTAFFAKALNLGDANMGAKRQKYIISYYAKASVAGHVIALYLRGFQNDGSSYDSPGATQQALTTGWIRYSYVADMSANAFTGSQMILAIQLNRSGVANRSIWIDRIMVEPVVNNISEPSTYVVGNSFDRATATATALSLTETAVGKLGDKLTVTADSVTKLTGDLGKTNGAVQDEQRLRIEADSALSERITTAQTKANDAAAAVQSEMQARVNADGALSRRIDTAQATAGSASSAVQQVSKAQADMSGELNAQYTMRVQINDQYKVHHWGGFGIGISNTGGVVQSAFVVYSDQFILLNANGAGLSSPFSVVGGQTFISDAYIRDASITTAKIADASINSAKIANASISAAKIGVAEIDTLRIRGNAVTVPVSYSVQGQVRGAGRFQWMDIINISVPMDEAGYVFIMFNCGQYYTDGARASGFTLSINGVQLMGNGGQPATPAPVVSGSIAVGPGVHNIKVTWYGDDASVFLDSRNIFVMGTKR